MSAEPSASAYHAMPRCCLFSGVLLFQNDLFNFNINFAYLFNFNINLGYLFYFDIKLILINTIILYIDSKLFCLLLPTALLCNWYHFIYAASVDMIQYLFGDDSCMIYWVSVYFSAESDDLRRLCISATSPWINKQ
jgi:hypothetical protein